MIAFVLLSDINNNVSYKKLITFSKNDEVRNQYLVYYIDMRKI